MTLLLAQRCLHHPLREAVARCPECTRFFCRECITEHDGRVLCSDCLRRISSAPVRTRRDFGPLWRTSAALLGAAVACLFFYSAGRLLLKTPTALHEGTLWPSQWLQEEEP